MKTEEIIKRQMGTRLARLKARSVALAAEIAMVESYLADAEKTVTIPRLRLRKNSVAKWSIQAQVRRELGEKNGSMRAQHLFEILKKSEPGLKSSTFRSHIKRMADAGVIKQVGSRGHYQSAETPNQHSEKKEVVRSRSRRDVYKTYIDV